MQVLESMADDPKNEIWVLSGLPVKGALERLAKRVPRFTEQMLGSFVKEHATSVMWHFWTGPPDSTVLIDDDATTTTNDICSPPVNTAISPSSDSHHSDHSWAHCQAAKAQNHIFDSLGEQCTVGMILHPGGPAHSPLSGGTGVGDADYDGWWSGTTVGSSAGRMSGTTGGRVSSAGESILVLGIGGDEKLLRWLNELNNAKMVSMSKRGTDARWKLDPREVLVLHIHIVAYNTLQYHLYKTPNTVMYWWNNFPCARPANSVDTHLHLCQMALEAWDRASCLMPDPAQRLWSLGKIIKWCGSSGSPSLK
ncbi:hypothetical protein EDC04DRAFT_2607090 [Pisolithus marmoratus]|nr:hypothetical protein EDC04DRAFT_2607090 [Pisolithus marmoratus]